MIKYFKQVKKKLMEKVEDIFMSGVSYMHVILFILLAICLIIYFIKWIF